MGKVYRLDVVEDVGIDVGLAAFAFVGNYRLHVSFVLQSDTHSRSVASLVDVRRKYHRGYCGLPHRAVERLGTQYRKQRTH